MGMLSGGYTKEMQEHDSGIRFPPCFCGVLSPPRILCNPDKSCVPFLCIFTLDISFPLCYTVSVLTQIIHLPHTKQKGGCTVFDIDLMSRTPIYEQLYRKVTELVLKGVLKEQDKLPSVRVLATELGVNPNTVSKAYTLLERDGIIYSLTGRGSFIAKPDKLLAQDHLLKDFDIAAEKAMDSGITKGTLAERLEKLTVKEEPSV